MDGNEDNSMVGRTFAHPKADMSTKRTRAKPQGVAGRMFVAVTAGFVFGYCLGIVVAPSVAFSFALGGSLLFGAVMVASFLFRPAPADEYASGFARTDEDVRKALADIEARKK